MIFERVKQTPGIAAEIGGVEENELDGLSRDRMEDCVAATWIRQRCLAPGSIKAVDSLEG
ncbi:hypothetical protein B7R25_17055 [Subtercola boreus]|uniref:Uncharacterized protein n=1 Tax=Subtercola boreus TaxID=120213 RepID=A0A3E0W7E6_9MICO|nr:hypothetical protein B7R24_16955 [Subtercola boreus]RFA17672.1 hypothetical protein B7R23_16900 [Subtercola boreus]RFA24262.1 hypothetical protein B7R25_17055 [Subtercola boreus]